MNSTISVLRQIRGVLLASLAVVSCVTQAERTPILVPRPMPADITPQINVSQCGGFTGHFGPLDYRTAHPLDKRVVEEFHFDMELRTFLSGRVVGRNRAGTSAVVGGFDYVLQAFPNHPVALLVMEQLGRKLNSEQPQNNEIPLECYYIRAFMTTPDDPVVRAMYGIYLAYRGRIPEAIQNLDIGDDGLRASGPMQYQIGMANVMLKRWDKAQLNALRTKRAGFPLDAIEHHLREVGKWNEMLKLPDNDLVDPEAEAAAASASEAMAASAPRQWQQK